MSPRHRFITPLAAALSILAGCSDNPTAPAGPKPDAPLAGGATTIFDATSRAFSTPAPNLAADALTLHLQGEAAFASSFVASPAPVNGGLGPVFNNNSCVSCHAGAGRGSPPDGGSEASESMSLLMSLDGDNPDGTGSPLPVPGFGSQLQTRAVFPARPMGSMQVSYHIEMIELYKDGTPCSLRLPISWISTAYQELPPGVVISPRVAPPIFGRGLLEAIDDATLLALADEGDADADGISGRPNYVWDYAAQRVRIGRFGLKANSPSLRQHIASEYRGEMGITNSVFDVETSFGTEMWDGVNDEPEIDDATLDAATFYVQTLAVPARRNVKQPEVRRGERLFARANCTGCHVPSLTTGELPGVPQVSNQTIYAYTDLLLHDMGRDLADERPDFAASGREWRTPPLWGLGLTSTVSGHTFFLHDGRARTLMEAIMWHGGEAEQSREFVRNLSQSDRDALVAFLESL